SLAAKTLEPRTCCGCNLKLQQTLAGELGFEPRQADPESAVLPLHHSPRRPPGPRRDRRRNAVILTLRSHAGKTLLGKRTAAPWVAQWGTCWTGCRLFWSFARFRVCNCPRDLLHQQERKLP